MTQRTFTHAFAEADGWTGELVMLNTPVTVELEDEIATNSAIELCFDKSENEVYVQNTAEHSRVDAEIDEDDVKSIIAFFQPNEYFVDVTSTQTVFNSATQEEEEEPDSWAVYVELPGGLKLANLDNGKWEGVDEIPETATEITRQDAENRWIV